MHIMMNNTYAGIQLAQEGRRVEALAYLRRAVMTEPVSAEVWLWLAHVSPDPLEYRACVQHALALQSDHPTALRMQQDIEFQDKGLPPPILAVDAAQTLSGKDKRSVRGRRILLLLLAIVMVGGCGFLGRSLLGNIDTGELGTVLPFLEQPDQSLQFSIENTQEIFQFGVDVPAGWILADSGSPKWRSTRDQLQAQFPPEPGAENFWRTLESDFGKAERDPISGEFIQPLAIIETTPSHISKSPNLVGHMLLVAIEDYPDTSCPSLRQLAEEQRQVTSQSSAFVALAVRERQSGGCIYVREYIHNQATRFFQLVIPVGASQLALWNLTLPESLYQDTYRTSAERIINSLQYIPAAPTQEP